MGKWSGYTTRSTVLTNPKPCRSVGNVVYSEKSIWDLYDHQTEHPLTHLFSIQVEQCSTPETVAHKRSPQPHEDNEENEIAMVVMTNTVKYPR